MMKFFEIVRLPKKFSGSMQMGFYWAYLKKKKSDLDKETK